MIKQISNKVIDNKVSRLLFESHEIRAVKNLFSSIIDKLFGTSYSVYTNYYEEL